MEKSKSINSVYGSLFKSNNNDLIGSLNFDNYLRKNNCINKLNRLFEVCRGWDEKISGYWVMERGYLSNIHFHFVMKLDENQNKGEDRNFMKNVIFKYWKFNGSVKVNDYNEGIGSYESYMSKSLDYNNFEWGFI